LPKKRKEIRIHTLPLTTMTDNPDAATTFPSDWKYVSEGGATIVFSYAGLPRPEFTRTVLRLRKSVTHPPLKAIQEPPDPAKEWERENKEGAWTTHSISNDGAALGTDGGKEEEPDDPTIEFQKCVTSLLIPQEHLPHLEPVHVQREWLQDLARLSEAQRPPERRAKDGIDQYKTKAVLATDLVGGKVMAVEIKVSPMIFL
jgi:inositol-pentakisphosphate 2-kinase